MVSRQETARQLLTPGEVMQLSPDEEVVQVSGAPPIRALKVRYYLDARLARRVGVPPAAGVRLAGPVDDWSAVREVAPRDTAVAKPVDEGGHRIEPELAGMEQEATAPIEPDATLEVDSEGDEAQQAADMQRRFRTAARQAALDPDDGIAL